MSERRSPLASIAASFLTGASAGISVLAGAVWLNPDAATLAFDWFGDGLGLADALIPAWCFGHVALIVHHILPGIARA